MYNVFVERGNVAVLQCGVPASVRDSVEVRKNFQRREELGAKSDQELKYAEGLKCFNGTGARLVEGGPARESRASLGGKVALLTLPITLGPFPLNSLSEFSHLLHSWTFSHLIHSLSFPTQFIL